MPKFFGNTETSELPYEVRIMCHWRNIVLSCNVISNASPFHKKIAYCFHQRKISIQYLPYVFFKIFALQRLSEFYTGNHTNYGTCFFPADEQTHSRDLSCTEALREKEAVLLSTSDFNQLFLPVWRRTGEMQERPPNASFISVCLASVSFTCPYYSDFPWDKAWPWVNIAATLLEAKRTLSIIMQMSGDYKCKDFMWLEKVINEVLTYIICSPFPPLMHLY